ncbi:MAG TPA: multifunctional oxoglutarate decarboxylase/oxoglutarate dehydrogenase thiamine pyrophosphate-binding subunit/dihydrolipoyllysine-residue succinyltransferase subunit [Jatrophihabitans sp.]|nr:multifunctional oxoglutarate decarboxylase/oxoglutarate dehydrogenase thiamine pyrophosphate-binding subunit/dihydrolipoyllysine-residue succinyltransferase subunit [Jatrophihabitans sp.]
MTAQSETGSEPATSHTDFGANEWLVEEMYERYLADPNAVDAAWHDFFTDYRPAGGSAQQASNGHAASAEPGEAPAAAGSRPQQPAVPADSAPGAGPSATDASPRATASDASATSTPPASAATPATTGATAPGSAAATPGQDGKATPGQDGKAPATKAAAAKPSWTDPAVAPVASDEAAVLRGAPAKVVTNMQASLEIPTATSVRAVPAKLLADNRIIINNHLRRARGGKVSFTHLIGYAVVRALHQHPEMNHSFAMTAEGKPALVKPEHVNFGLAIDLPGKDGGRSLVVAAIKAAETMDFSAFWTAYEDIIRRARAGKLTADDFAGSTISLTNPGTIGTNHSVPRLMQGQGTIVGVGSMEYPAEFSGMHPDALADMGISKIMTLTSTYDHRIIQGAQSGEFLRTVHQLLLGEDNFYYDIFASLRIPYEPAIWLTDREFSHEGQIDKAARVIELINAYRTSGHLMADTDPLEFKIRSHPDLDITKHGLTIWDLDREFPVGGFAGQKLMKLRDILGVLRDAYCRRVGVEYMHIIDPEERAWIQQHVEVKNDAPTKEQQKHILSRLNVAEAFETFLQTKYVGQKRFSLEGGETVIALLDEVLSTAAGSGLDEVVIGMPHRGRLNVLANIVGKPYAKIFNEFEGNIDPGTAQGSGDVKYHLGAHGTYSAADGSKVAVELTANPSHLEAVNPVLEGIVRAKQDILDKGEDGFTVLPLLMHGDAAFAGQGVVAETLNLSQLRGYRTGGTVHVVVNNQVGFTTSPAQSRSSLYCTDIARMISAPIFHVNGDDPEACVRVARLAVEYRLRFKKDVVIDMVCYRRRGHNESDNPSFTQPMMYDIIDNKRSVRKLYTEALIGRGDITLDDAEEALRDFRAQLEKVFVETRDASSTPRPEPAMDESPEEPVVPTAIPAEVIKTIGELYANHPANFTIHPRLKPQIDRRVAQTTGGDVDWATAELLAFGSLTVDGKAVRLAGQDSRRGTFTQRHAVLIDRTSGEEYTPLRHIPNATAPFRAYDSLLSEYAAMGFEYGYSVANKDALVLWEAQFGDFADGAQTIIDEFIASGEAKWGQRSSVTLLLPHGYEGQGPDHSSGRPERFLQLAAENNMTVAMCSTPANYFHLLRRQSLAGLHRPLVAFTPKSLLRLKAAVSQLDEFTEGSFQAVIGDGSVDPAQVSRVVLCSGKIYYDLAAARAEANRTDVAIVRLEQLYPLHGDEIAAELAKYPNAQLIWAQEEPANQGGYPFIALNLPERLAAHGDTRPIYRASRKASASPAVGSVSVHEAQQREVVATALG